MSEHTPGSWQEIRKASPARPGDTCPTIDALQGMAGGCADDLALIRAQMAKSKSSAVRDLSDDIMTVESTLSSIRLTLEDLRVSNEALRAASRHWYLVAKDLHAELEGKVESIACGADACAEVRS